MQTDGQTDMTKLTVDFRSSANAPKKPHRARARACACVCVRARACVCVCAVPVSKNLTRSPKDRRMGGTLTRIWRAAHRQEQFLQYIVTSDEICTNHAATERKKNHNVELSIVSTSKEIRSTSISNNHQGTSIVGPRRRVSCGFPWPHWYYNCCSLLWYTLKVTAGHSSQRAWFAAPRPQHFARDFQAPHCQNYVSTALRLWTTLLAVSTDKWCLTIA
jgi:hypothetical protein